MRCWKKYPACGRTLGECPLVTPSSQIVGTQAVFNVLMGERYKMVTKETQGRAQRQIRSHCEAV